MSRYAFVLLLAIGVPAAVFSILSAISVADILPIDSTVPVPKPAPVAIPSTKILEPPPVQKHSSIIIQGNAKAQMVDPVAVAVTSTDHTALFVQSIFGFFSLIVTSITAIFLRRIDKKASVAEFTRGSIAQVTADAAQITDAHRIDETAKQNETLAIVKGTHALVNNNHRVALVALAASLRRIAELTKVTADITAADNADQAVVDHDKGDT